MLAKASGMVCVYAELGRTRTRISAIASCTTVEWARAVKSGFGSRTGAEYLLSARANQERARSLPLSRELSLAAPERHSIVRRYSYNFVLIRRAGISS